jgi:hypothetical protein
MYVFAKLFIQMHRTILVFAGAEGKSSDLPGILGAISKQGCKEDKGLICFLYPANYREKLSTEVSGLTVFRSAYIIQY